MHGINLDPDAMKAIGVAAKEMYEFAAFREKIEELKSSLRDLYDISGEANIPLTSVKNVRKMGEFLRVRERAGKILAREEQL
jgi:hypothetical protein